VVFTELVVVKDGELDRLGRLAVCLKDGVGSDNISSMKDWNSLLVGRGG
jgi:hypothetical protein